MEPHSAVRQLIKPVSPMLAHLTLANFGEAGDLEAGAALTRLNHLGTRAASKRGTQMLHIDAREIINRPAKRLVRDGRGWTCTQKSNPTGPSA